MSFILRMVVWICIVLVLLSGPTATLAQWTFTGSFAATTQWHQAIQVKTGEVVAIGGQQFDGINCEPQIYLPSLGSWHYGACFTGDDEGLSEFTATLLQNGQILVAGGFEDDGNSEIYDTTYSQRPGENYLFWDWIETGSLNVPRYRHTATLLNNGLVLAVGGQGYADWYSSTELFSLSTGTWTYTGSMNVARFYHTASLLQNGGVLVAGGIGPNSSGSTSYLSSAEIYISINTTYGTWSYTGGINEARYLHTSTLLENGQVIIVGGIGSNGALASAELFDPSLGAWSVTGSLTTSRQQHTATLMPDGKVLVAGGDQLSVEVLSAYLRSCEIYDPLIGSWTNFSSLNNPRYGHATTLLSNGLVMVSGGLDATVEIYGLLGPTPTPTATPTPVWQPFFGANGQYTVLQTIETVTANANDYKVNVLFCIFAYKYVARPLISEMLTLFIHHDNMTGLRGLFQHCWRFNWLPNTNNKLRSHVLHTARYCVR